MMMIKRMIVINKILIHDDHSSFSSETKEGASLLRRVSEEVASFD